MPPPIVFSRMPEASGDILNQKRMHKYCLTGIYDEALALNYALMNIPAYLTTEALFRQNVSQSTPGSDLHYFDVEYGPVPMFAGTWRVSYETTGGTIHWDYSLECVDAYQRDGADPLVDEKLKTTAVGLLDDGTIQGTERVVPAAKRTYTYRQPKGVVTEAYMDYLEAITGVVNSVPWHGRPAGEVLFLGARGTSTFGAENEADIAFEMAFMKNITGVTYGNDTTGKVLNVDKKGHHFLDVVFEDKENPLGGVLKHPRLIRIHRMYEELPLGLYLGF